ncbi:hypothetical protein [Candidatus Chlorohelix sp.]|uniref:hypothetical protein n=1 Tax=Candidatus Chlorohelix sp. TaxID=3139201 RepID=UPI003043D399
MVTDNKAVTLTTRKQLALGICEYHHDNKEAAFEHFQKALELEPYNETALIWCGRLSCNPEEAKMYLNRILSRNPSNIIAQRYYELVEKKSRANNKQATIKTLKEYYDNNKVQVLVADYLIKRGILNELKVRAALHYQACMRLEGKIYRLDEILSDFGYHTEAQMLSSALAFLDLQM